MIEETVPSRRLSRSAVRSRARLIQGLLIVATLLVVYALTRHHEDSALPAYDAAAFEQARAAGKPLVVLIHAVWCPTCASMDRTLAAMQQSERFTPVGFYHVDYDEQKSVVRTYKVSAQSTLIVFKDGEEVARTIALTDPAALQAFVAQALALADAPSGTAA